MTNNQSLYTSLLDHPRATRLIQVAGLNQEGLLSLTTRDVNLDDEHVYLALSYVWGVGPPSYRIVVNGQAFWIRHNLWSFFVTHYEKLSQKTWLWIDSICINQDDVPEKNRQVPLMGQIYAGAATVVSWMHDSAPMQSLNHELNIDIIDLINLEEPENMDLRNNVGTSHAEAMAGALWRLFSHEYWTRVWIIQEVQLAQNVEIRWGRHIFSAQKLVNFVARLSDHPYLLAALRSISSDQLEKRIQVLDRLNNRYTGEGVKRPRLIDLVLQMRDLSCSIPHDHVYGLLSLADDGHRLKPDYAEHTSILLMRLIHGQEEMPQQADVEKIAQILGLDLLNFPFPTIGRWELSRRSTQYRRAWSDSNVFTLCRNCCPKSWWSPSVAAKGLYEKVLKASRAQYWSTIPPKNSPDLIPWHGFIVGFPAISLYIGVRAVSGPIEGAKGYALLNFAFIMAPESFASTSPDKVIHIDSLLAIELQNIEGVATVSRFASMHFNSKSYTSDVHSNSSAAGIYELMGTIRETQRAASGRSIRNGGVGALISYCDYIEEIALPYDPSRSAEFKDEWDTKRSRVIMSLGRERHDIWIVDPLYLKTTEQSCQNLDEAISEFDGGLCRANVNSGYDTPARRSILSRRRDEDMVSAQTLEVGS